MHIARLILDQVFGAARFQSEIIWTYRRWSNASKGLLPAHQTILFTSKSADFKFNTLLTDYSPATNIDQITQRRVRDERNKAVYARDEQGNVVSNGAKKGVPLSDVWDIPYEAATALCSAATTKGDAHLVLIVTEDNELSFGMEPPKGVTLIRSTALRMKDTLCRALVTNA